MSLSVFFAQRCTYLNSEANRSSGSELCWYVNELRGANKWCGWGRVCKSWYVAALVGVGGGGLWGRCDARIALDPGGAKDAPGEAEARGTRDCSPQAQNDGSQPCY